MQRSQGQVGHTTYTTHTWINDKEGIDYNMNAISITTKTSMGTYACTGLDMVTWNKCESTSTHDRYNEVAWGLGNL